MPNSAINPLPPVTPITRHISLKQLPTPHQNIADQTHYIVGDLHANPLKLIAALVESGILKTLHQDDWDDLLRSYLEIDTCQGYSQGSNNHRYYWQFMVAVEKLQLNDADTLGRCPDLIFLGDECCDRGKCDLFILAIFDRLHKQGLPPGKCQIIQSNHTVEFHMAYGASRRRASLIGTHRPLAEQTPALSAHRADKCLSRSLRGLDAVVEAGLLSQAKLDAYVTSHKRLHRLFSYVLASNGDITLLSHAPISPAVIEAVAKKFDVPFKADTAADLAQTIDFINICYREYLQADRLSLLVSTEKLKACFRRVQAAISEFPLEYAWWNRTPPPDDVKYAFHWFNVHGHTDDIRRRQSHLTLNGLLGQPSVPAEVAVVDTIVLSREQRPAHQLSLQRGKISPQQILTMTSAVLHRYVHRLRCAQANSVDQRSEQQLRWLQTQIHLLSVADEPLAALQQLAAAVALPTFSRLFADNAPRFWRKPANPDLKQTLEACLPPQATQRPVRALA